MNSPFTVSPSPTKATSDQPRTVRKIAIASQDLVSSHHCLPQRNPAVVGWDLPVRVHNETA
jgi:hypothetical protein